MIDFFLSLQPAVQAAIVAAIVSVLTAILSTPLRYAIDKRALRHKLSIEYEYEQRKQLRHLIGRFHGRLIEASEQINFRLWNLYTNHGEPWLTVRGDYSEPTKNYYFTSTAYRFLAVLAHVRRFEMESIYIDSRIAEAKDLEFLKYLKALQWVCTDVSLFKGLKYDSNYSTDHFFSDTLRQICDSCWRDNQFLSIQEFQTRMTTEPLFEPVLHFFDGLNPEENRYRWDRFVCFHLLILAFSNSFGYEMRKTTDDQLLEVAQKILHNQIRSNLTFWIAKLGLSDQKEVKALLQALAGGAKGG